MKKKQILKMVSYKNVLIFCEIVVRNKFLILELATDEDEIDETIAYANEKRKPLLMTVVC